MKNSDNKLETISFVMNHESYQVTDPKEFYHITDSFIESELKRHINYVNFKGTFWVQVTEGKIEKRYKIVDNKLKHTMTIDGNISDPHSQVTRH